jgi:hypothetical protein
VSNDSKRRDAITAYIYLLGNPYAKEQLIGLEEQQPGLTQQSADADLRPATADERAYARRQQNQYALLSVAISDVKAAPSAAPSSADELKDQLGNKATLSKNDFIAGCRRIFRHYIPSVERGRLRRHHRDFITRNQNRSASTRQLLMQELSKYDLSAVPGVEVRFNREREDLTDQKLKQIEKSVSNKESS